MGNFPLTFIRTTGDAGLIIMQLTAGQTSDLVLKVTNPGTVYSSKSVTLAMKGQPHGGFYPPGLYMCMANLLGRMYSHRPYFERMDAEDLELSRDYPMHPGDEGAIHDDGHTGAVLRVRREDHGYRFWVDELQHPDEFAAKNGVVVDRQHLHGGAWDELERVGAILNHPTLTGLNAMRDARVRQLNKLPAL
ncbi:MAG TPA: hypothetical protein VHP58_00350 [Alphaproteobacteria bacterium]|nr:hypothetical protein [Alphaproteobacteria bacterium]